MSYIDEHVVYVDCETTGLDPERHEVWDIALIDGATGVEYEWHIRPQRPLIADPGALRITNFYRRSDQPDFWLRGSAVSECANDIARLTSGKHLVGAVPSFDAAFIGRFLVANGQREAWHYHLIDIEALAAGYLGMKPPWDSDELNKLLGLPEATDKHTAIGDARWAKAVYEKVLYERNAT